MPFRRLSLHVSSTHEGSVCKCMHVYVPPISTRQGYTYRHAYIHVDIHTYMITNQVLRTTPMKASTLVTRPPTPPLDQRIDNASSPVIRDGVPKLQISQIPSLQQQRCHVCMYVCMYVACMVVKLVWCGYIVCVYSSACICMYRSCLLVCRLS